MTWRLFLSSPLPPTLYNPVQIPMTALFKLPSERQQRPSIPRKYFASNPRLLSDVCCNNSSGAIWQEATDSRMKNGHWMSDCWASLLQELVASSLCKGLNVCTYMASAWRLVQPAFRHAIFRAQQKHACTRIIRRNPKCECINLCCNFIDIEISMADSRYVLWLLRLFGSK